MTSKNILPRKKIADFIDNLYDRGLACQASVVTGQRNVGSAGECLVGSACDRARIGPGIGQTEAEHERITRATAGYPISAGSVANLT